MKSAIQLLLCLAILLVAGCSVTPQGPEDFIGKPPPKVSFASINKPHDDLTFADFKGKVILVDMWATWCGPCKILMPGVQKLHDEYKDKGLAVIAVSDETPDEITRFRERNGFTYPMYTDPMDKVQKAFHNEGIPCTVVIDRKGNVVYAVVGVADGPDPDAELRKAVASAIGG